MVTTELKRLVFKEANALKQHATAEEISKLNFNKLNPVHNDSCIYGQMTGDCFSQRAVQLLDLCTVPFSSHPCVHRQSDDNHFGVARVLRDFSPIEFYITQDGAKNENLVAYIKGETYLVEL